MAHSLARVLYVEDQPAVASVVVLELEQAQISVTTVPNGDKCLAVAREQPFDLILLDQLMPGMDGLELCRRLKQDPALKDIPVIFFTAFSNRHHEREARRVGAADYLRKGSAEPQLAMRILAEVERLKARNAPPPDPQRKPGSWLQGLLNRL